MCTSCSFFLFKVVLGDLAFFDTVSNIQWFPTFFKKNDFGSLIDIGLILQVALILHFGIT